MNDIECNVNRLFEVDIIANCDKKLCAVTFELSFDSDMFEFKDAKSNYSDSMVKSNVYKGGAKIVYLCSYGENISRDTSIFTVTFKAIKAGNGHINYNVYECVDDSIEFMQVGNCKAADITVTGKTQTDDNNKTSTKSSSYKNDKNDKNNKPSTTTSLSTIDNLGLLNPIKDNRMSYMFLGVLIGFGIVILLSAAFLLGKKSANKDEKTKE